MQKNINFISTQTQQKIKISRLLRSVMLFLVGVLVTIFIIYSVSLPVILSLNLRSKDIDNKIEQVKKEIDQNKQIESMIQTTRLRSVVVEDVIKKNNLTRYLDALVALTENGYSFKSNLDVTDFESEIEVLCSVPDSVSLVNVANFMDDLIAKKYINRYSVDTIQMLKNGGYEVLVIINGQS